jgi:hypothetical protein
MADHRNSGPSAAAGQPNITNAAASSIRASTWPYKRTADVSRGRQILLRPPDAAPASQDPTLAAIADLNDTMSQVLRATRLLSAPWLTPPPDAESLHLATAITLPAIDGLFHVVLQVVCPPGRNGVINEIANDYIGPGFTNFSGALIWQIARNPGSGVTTAERNYDNILSSLGSIQAPAPISPIRIFENDVMQFLLKNVSIAPAGEEVAALFGGYFYPKTWDDQWDRKDRNISW